MSTNILISAIVDEAINRVRGQLQKNIHLEKKYGRWKNITPQNIRVGTMDDATSWILYSVRKFFIQRHCSGNSPQEVNL